MAGLHLHDSSRHVGWQGFTYMIALGCGVAGLHLHDSSRHLGWQGFTYMIALGMWGGRASLT